jgi:hypothetical protein
MSLTVKILGRSPLLQGGDDTSGIISNDKEFVWGELAGSYVTGGIPFTPTNVGLTGTFDMLMLQPLTVNNTTTFTTTTQIRAVYDEVLSLMEMQTVAQNGDSTIATNAQTYVVNFFACGNSAKVANLT